MQKQPNSTQIIVTSSISERSPRGSFLRKGIEDTFVVARSNYWWTHTTPLGVATTGGAFARTIVKRLVTARTIFGGGHSC